MVPARVGDADRFCDLRGRCHRRVRMLDALEGCKPAARRHRSGVLARDAGCGMRDARCYTRSPLCGAQARARRRATAAAREMADVDTALDVIGTTLLQLVARLIAQGGETAAERAAPAMALHAWACVSRGARDGLVADETFAAVVFYERVRLRLVDPLYFFDGAPRTLSVFGAQTVIEFPLSATRDLLRVDVMKERFDSIEKLESGCVRNGGFKKMIQMLDKLQDLSRDVPLAVRIFVSRVRAMSASLRAAMPASHFAQCENQCCARLFYRGPPSRSADRVPRTDEAVATIDAAYWNATGALPLYEPQAHARFCCRACRREWEAHFHRLVLDPSTTYDADQRLPRDAPARIGTAFALALARNARARDAFRRRLRQRRHVAPAVRRADLTREVHARVSFLNVDLGLLYAAHLLARLRGSGGGAGAKRSLPGGRPGWREAGAIAPRALARVAALYRQHPEPAPIANLLHPPPFLRAVRRNLRELRLLM